MLFSSAFYSQIAFDESSITYGLNASYGTGFVGGGISFCDFDDDGWDDVTLATETGEPVRFFKNNSGSFTEIFPNITDYNYEYKQVIWIDYDNDGDKDLYMASHNAPGKLYRNDGNLNFTDVTLTSGIFTGNQKNFGASWGDYNNDGYLDVFLTYRSGVESNRLYKNNGDGTFSNVSSLAGLSNGGHFSFSASFFDYNNDGWQDIYIANDRHITTNILYHNNGDGTFTDVSAQSGSGLIIDAMSTTIGDYNNDGWFDIYITNTDYVYENVNHEIGNVFLRNNGDGTFSNIAVNNGTDFNSVAWGAVFLDADNDMDLDLYVSGMLDGSVSLPSAFYENDGFNNYTIPANAGFHNDTEESYSNAIGDFNNDGYPDIIVNNEAANMFLWENNCETNNNNWLKVHLEGTVSNKDGIGSIIEISINGNKQYRYTLAGEGYLSQNSNSEFFGLAENDTVDYIKVTWLSGLVDVINNVSANQTLTIIEGSNVLSNNEYFVDTINFVPNPVKDILTIYTHEPIDKVEIFNSLGKVIMTKNSNESIAKIDVSKLDSGVFFMRVFINQQTKVFKVIKN
ncbi:FG-GAP-like repeat-containing protein [Psychroserpens mesophilus]|uniref:FG-GAP-like repeat-containing protein n=1 Tax=Psychroserpens mesophilus TaxID=325473 RepID=UPI003D660B76